MVQPFKPNKPNVWNRNVLKTEPFFVWFPKPSIQILDIHCILTSPQVNLIFFLLLDVYHKMLLKQKQQSGEQLIFIYC